MGVKVKIHDCFGTIIRQKRSGTFEFLCDECFRPYAQLSLHGLKTDSRHGSKTDKNVASLKTLKWMISEVEKTKREKTSS